MSCVNLLPICQRTLLLGHERDSNPNRTCIHSFLGSGAIPTTTIFGCTTRIELAFSRLTIWLTNRYNTHTIYHLRFDEPGWKMGFEPTKLFRVLEPQSSAFDHSATTTILEQKNPNISVRIFILSFKVLYEIF